MNECIKIHDRDRFASITHPFSIRFDSETTMVDGSRPTKKKQVKQRAKTHTTHHTPHKVTAPRHEELVAPLYDHLIVVKVAKIPVGLNQDNNTSVRCEERELANSAPLLISPVQPSARASTQARAAELERRKNQDTELYCSTAADAACRPSPCHALRMG